MQKIKIISEEVLKETHRFWILNNAQVKAD